MTEIINNIRKEIDKIDDEIAELIEKRVNIAKKIVSLKRVDGKDIEDIQRENNIILRITCNKKTANLIENIFRRIFRWVKNH